MRLLGCGLIFLWGCLAGFCHKQKLERELRLWGSLLHFLQLISTELQTSLSTSREILDKAAARCKELTFLQNIHGEDSLQKQLYQAAETLKDRDFRTIVQRFADCFGAVSAESQLETLEVLQLLCREQLQLRRETLRARGQLSLNLGILSGAALAILLL